MNLNKIGSPRKLDKEKLAPIDTEIGIKYITDAEENIPTEEFESIKYPFPEFNPPQSAFYNIKEENANFIVCAATSAGKTVIAEMAKQGKFLYLSPLKAITEEKKDLWSDSKHAWSGLDVSIMTGDYTLTPSRVQELRQADIITLTSEMLDSRTRNINTERNDWLLDINTLVVDEFHLLGYKNRGDKLESALIRFSAQNPRVRIVALSATMTNTNVLAQWVSRLNGKSTYVINSTYRPVKLEKHYIQYNTKGSYGMRQTSIAEGAMNIIYSHPEDKIILFSHTKKMGRMMMNMLRDAGYQTEFHNADLGLQARKDLQERFSDKSRKGLRILIATSTLAWGVNTPADVVISLGIHRGIDLVDPMDIQQMVGRAGRIGFSNNPVGHAYVLLPENKFNESITYCENIPPVISKLLESDILCFHVLSEVFLKKVKNAETLMQWHSRSLAHFQGQPLTTSDAEEVLQTLTEIKMLRQNNKEYTITNLGKVSVFMYLSPFVVYDLYRNFNRLIQNNIPLNDVTFSWAFINTQEFREMFVSKTEYLNSLALTFAGKMQQYSIKVGTEISIYATALHSLINDSLNEVPIISIMKNTIARGQGRTVQAIKMIDSMYARWRIEGEIETYGIRMLYRAPERFVPLLRIPKIGLTRARKLYNAGIRSKQEFEQKKRTVRSIIGDTLASSIYDIL